MTTDVFDVTIGLLILGCVIILFLAAVYAIIWDAKTSGIRAARGEAVTLKKLLKNPGALILAVFFAIVVGVMLIPAMGFVLFFILWIIYAVMREYFKQKELKKIRKNESTVL
ncbi:hypothetical protein [Methanimicrococcus blatticola]|uniref:Uncharacterized protein n=1 Tax=Methanimicrococcus blatticola TaxID=91560 RepID=A0A484F2D4_9EURY|nr:hypothetical protein [Methanimicrococcus blatticola]MBZ3935410.1 hypothetical protein [Methanimicrococcus blatticola]MCC2508492.1 hypothetical protein [Methanimicrococcus blatticola]TDQ67800.1 hypothetical protein C7391_1353 [Methanimicrococcus blatticola]